MNNPNYNIGLNKPYDYHLIGNFAPIPCNSSLRPSFQIIHRNCNEKWDDFLKYLEKNWESTGTPFPFEDYITLSYQDMYYSKKEKTFTKLDDVETIKSLIKKRGESISRKFVEIMSKHSSTY